MTSGSDSSENYLRLVAPGHACSGTNTVTRPAARRSSPSPRTGCSVPGWRSRTILGPSVSRRTSGTAEKLEPASVFSPLDAVASSPSAGTGGQRTRWPVNGILCTQAVMFSSLLVYDAQNLVSDVQVDIIAGLSLDLQESGEIPCRTQVRPGRNGCSKRTIPGSPDCSGAPGP